MAQTSYTGSSNNSFLTIANGLLAGAQSGLNMYTSMGGSFGGGGTKSIIGNDLSMNFGYTRR
jgi:hypothetical protein